MDDMKSIGKQKVYRLSFFEDRPDDVRNVISERVVYQKGDTYWINLLGSKRQVYPLLDCFSDVVMIRELKATKLHEVLGHIR